MRLNRTVQYAKIEQKFFKKHRDLIQKYKTVLEKLVLNPFDYSLKTHKLNRIILTIEIKDDQITLINIGTHDDVY